MVALYKQLHSLGGREAGLVLDFKHVENRRQNPQRRAILRNQQGIQLHTPELMAHGCGSKVTAVINRSLPATLHSRIGTPQLLGSVLKSEPWKLNVQILGATTWPLPSLRCTQNTACLGFPLRGRSSR